MTMVDVMYGCGSEYDHSEEEEFPEVELKEAHDRIIATTTGMDLMAELASSPLLTDVTVDGFEDLEVRFDPSPLFDPFIVSSVSASNKKSRTACRTNRKTNLLREDTGQYYSPEFILKEGLKKRKGSIHQMHKPYVCPVPGCGKYYKNPNGIKYHAKYGHSAPQEFPCHCGKMYSTRHGLMAHKKIHGPSGSGWPPFESKNNWQSNNKM